MFLIEIQHKNINIFLAKTWNKIFGAFYEKFTKHSDEICFEKLNQLFYLCTLQYWHKYLVSTHMYEIITLFKQYFFKHVYLRYERHIWCKFGYDTLII